MAATEAAVRADLRRQGVVPSRIKKQSQGLFSGGGKITPSDIAIFSRQLATMLGAGIPLVQSFEIVGTGHDNAAMQKLILAVKADVEGGSALAEALAKHPLYFDDLFVNLVEAGEQAGALETLLDKIATYKEKTEALKKKIKKALTYPAAVLVVAFVVTTILLIFVIPAFEDLFQGFGADLPTFTRNGYRSCRLFVAKGWYLAIMIGIGIAASFISRNDRGQCVTGSDRMSLKIPVIGPILQKALSHAMRVPCRRCLLQAYRLSKRLSRSPVRPVTSSTRSVSCRCAMKYRRVSACSRPWKTPTCSRTW